MENVFGVDNGVYGFYGFYRFSGFRGFRGKGGGFAAFFLAMPEGRREEVRSQMSNVRCLIPNP